MTWRVSLVETEAFKESMIRMPIKFVVEAWAVVGVQINQESPLRITTLAPAGAPAARLILNLSPLAGGLMRNRKVVLGAMIALVSKPGIGVFWFTVTLNETLVWLLVG